MSKRNGMVVNKWGTKEWYKDDVLHREDGPAVERGDGCLLYTSPSPRD